MKHAEDDYKTNMSLETYNSVRRILDYFNRDTFETYTLCPELIELIRRARSTYKKSEDSKKSAIEARTKSASMLRRQVGVFVRQTPTQAKRAFQEIDQEMEKAEQRLEELKAKRRQLLDIQKERDNVISNSVIDKMFRR